MADNIRPDGLMAGDRVYKGKGLGEITIWKCPSCATENTGDLAKGCVHCGAGSAQARHIGVPPPPTRRQTPLREDINAEAGAALITPVDQAFERWYQMQTTRGYFDHKAPHTLLLEAWSAGIAWYRTRLQQQANVDEPAEGQDPGIVGVPRELLKDVLKQLENTVDIPETDSQSPELLALINRIRELVE